MFGCQARRPIHRRLELTALILILTAALPACAPPLTVPSATARPEPEPAAGVAALLRYAETLPQQSEAALGEELAAIAAAPPETWSAADTIRYALLHVEGGLRLGDPNDARRALERLLARPEEADEIRMLARLLLGFFRAGAAEGAGNSLVVAYAPLAGSASPPTNAELESLRSELAAENRRRLELERQLEALRALEAALDQRAASTTHADD